MSNHRNLSLERSKYAWESAILAKNELGGSFKEYLTLVKNLPANISNSGLGQTLAFLSSKGKKKETLLLDSIEKWLTVKTGIYTNDQQNPNWNIIQWIQSGDIDQYRWATSELMELITWLKLHSSSLNIKDNRISQMSGSEDNDGKNSAAATDDQTNSQKISDDEDSDTVSEPLN